MYCRKCGKAISEDSEFCMHCGTKVEIVEEATPIPATPEEYANPQQTTLVQTLNDLNAIDDVSAPLEIPSMEAIKAEAIPTSVPEPIVSFGSDEWEDLPARAPLWQPTSAPKPAAKETGSYFVAFKKYAVFRGRASRTEHWEFFFWNLLVYILLFTIDVAFNTPAEIGIGPLSGLYTLFVTLPWVAVMVRRLHDTGRSGWWYFIIVIPVLGWIAMLVVLVQDSDPNENQYGPNPKLEVS